MAKRKVIKSKGVRPKERKTGLQIAFGKAVRKARLEKGLSQEELADLAGLHFTYVSSVERGERNISIENIARLAKALGCQLLDLMPMI
jgi:transcriptional regulator with XRE-family HTH domain